LLSLAQANHDDSFREIQLSGKQLVFLFMAVIVILVGVFLMGLQVGRGVLMARGAPGAETTAGATEAEPPPPPASASPGSSTSPATAKEKLSYAERLGAPEPPKETLKPETAAPPATPPTPKSDAPVPAPTTATPPATKSALPATKSAPPAKNAAVTPPPKTAEPAASSAEPGGPGFAIQVAAVREVGEADAMVKRLAAKGYSAYVFRPAKSDGIYRVRVGKFKDRREADTVAARLQKEEQFKPWIVR
jgi:cell division septation protein DedD